MVVGVSTVAEEDVNDGVGKNLGSYTDPNCSRTQAATRPGLLGP